MQPWTTLARATAPDGTPLELRARAHEYLILAGGYDLMSSEDEASSRALAELGCAHLDPARAQRVLVGGLGMGFTARAALDCTGATTTIEVAELVPAVVEWNRDVLGPLARHPLDNPRCTLWIGDVAERIRASRGELAAILLDVDNGPDALAHDRNQSLYDGEGIARAHRALAPGGVLAVWSFSDDPRFTARLERGGFSVRVQRVPASRKGRGRHHVIWVARRG